MGHARIGCTARQILAVELGIGGERQFAMTVGTERVGVQEEIAEGREGGRPESARDADERVGGEVEM